MRGGLLQRRGPSGRLFQQAGQPAFPELVAASRAALPPSSPCRAGPRTGVRPCAACHWPRNPLVPAPQVRAAAERCAHPPVVSCNWQLCLRHPLHQPKAALKRVEQRRELRSQTAHCENSLRCDAAPSRPSATDTTRRPNLSIDSFEGGLRGPVPPSGVRHVARPHEPVRGLLAGIWCFGRVGRDPN